MRSYWSLWVLINSNASLNVLMGPHTFFSVLWVLRGPCRSLCNSMDCKSPYGSLAVLMRLYGSLCVLISPYATLYVFMGPCSCLCVLISRYVSLLGLMGLMRPYGF